MNRSLTYLKGVIKFLFLIKRQIIYIIFHYLNWPKEKQCKEIFSTFKNKNVLILGAGESLSRLNQKIICNYDHVIAINHSIDITSKYEIKNLHFYTCDTNAMLENLKKKKFKKVNSIFFPFQTSMPFKVLRISLLPNINLIRPNICFKWKTYKKNNFIKYPSLEVKVVKNFDIWINQKNNYLRPLTLYSSFYSLALLLMKFKVKKIASIGIDFSYGYSNLLGPTDFAEPYGNHYLYNINEGSWPYFQDKILRKYTIYEKL